MACEEFSRCGVPLTSSVQRLLGHSDNDLQEILQDEDKLLAKLSPELEAFRQLFKHFNSDTFTSLLRQYVQDHRSTEELADLQKICLDLSTSNQVPRNVIVDAIADLTIFASTSQPMDTTKGEAGGRWNVAKRLLENAPRPISKDDMTKALKSALDLAPRQLGEWNNSLWQGFVADMPLTPGAKKVAEIFERYYEEEPSFFDGCPNNQAQWKSFYPISIVLSLWTKMG
jgi:hypothetical protein